MIKKISNIIFIILFFVMLCTPLLFANFIGGETSNVENRYLANFPQLVKDGSLNHEFSADVESWLMDNMGFRKEMIMANARLQFGVFGKFSTDNHCIGRNGDLNYASPSMFVDYAHLNLRSPEEVQRIAQSYQTVSDYMNEQGAQFYYVQCYDKHSIYPEQFPDTVNQWGTVSKTDQVIEALQNDTTVNTISLKQPMLDAKEEYQPYSHWGDPTHWDDRGAFIGYQTIMNELNAHNDEQFRVLQEQDFDIRMEDVAHTYKYVKFTEDYQEVFSMKNPTSQQEDTSILGKWASDERHFAWKNENVHNDKKLLLFCDSYIASFIAEYFTESFSEVWLIRADYTGELPEIMELYHPDIVIYECAERVDRSNAVCNLADRLAS